MYFTYNPLLRTIWCRHIKHPLVHISVMDGQFWAITCITDVLPVLAHSLVDNFKLSDITKNKLLIIRSNRYKKKMVISSTMIAMIQC